MAALPSIPAVAWYLKGILPGNLKTKIEKQTNKKTVIVFEGGWFFSKKWILCRAGIFRGLCHDEGPSSYQLMKETW